MLSLTTRASINLPPPSTRGDTCTGNESSLRAAAKGEEVGDDMLVVVILLMGWWCFQIVKTGSAMGKQVVQWDGGGEDMMPTQPAQKHGKVRVVKKIARKFTCDKFRLLKLSTNFGCTASRDNGGLHRVN